MHISLDYIRPSLSSPLESFPIRTVIIVNLPRSQAMAIQEADFLGHANANGTPRKSTSAAADSAPLEYWQVNVTPEQRTLTCPVFLRHMSAKDISILRTPDSEYRILSWDEVRDIIARNRIDVFLPVPSELAR